MAKTKTPFLSLESHGTVGQAITSQKRGRETLLREKPLPAYRYTLPQAYQRWDYRDYAYRWKQQSEATRRASAAAGSRIHLTGFQYWMKLCLNTLPDLGGRWHLDEATGAIAYDSSLNANNGIIFGASPTTGLIDGCRAFDGLNDYIEVPFSPTLNTAVFSFEFHAKVTGGVNTDRSPVTSRSATPVQGYLMYCRAANVWEFWVGRPLAWEIMIGNPVVIDQWTFHCCIYDGTQMLWWHDGAYYPPRVCAFSPNPTWPFRLGAGKTEMAPTWFFPGLIDEFRYYNRVLDEVEIIRHSERRYP